MTDDIKSAINAAMDIKSIQKVPRDLGEKSYVCVKEGFRIETLNNHQERPDYKRGIIIFDSIKSFCWYVNKHKNTDETIIIADEDKGIITAIFNDHGSKVPGWGDFKAILNLGFSDEWITWYDNSKPQKENDFTQPELSDFLADNASNIDTRKNENEKESEKNISALKLRHLINRLKLTSKESFSSVFNEATGQIDHISYENEKLGTDSIEIPTSFQIVIPVYRHSDLFEITIRLRHNNIKRAIFFSYVIDQITSLKKIAFDNICYRITYGLAAKQEGENNQEESYPGTSIEVLRGKI